LILIIFAKKSMVHYQEITCPDCSGTHICKNGCSENGTQRWLCLNEDCSRRSFQLRYKYNAHKPGVKDQIDTQTLNSSGVRDIARNLSIDKNTVCSHLKKKTPKSKPLCT